jgi:hypothetical protein
VSGDPTGQLFNRPSSAADRGWSSREGIRAFARTGKVLDRPDFIAAAGRGVFDVSRPRE